MAPVSPRGPCGAFAALRCWGSVAVPTGRLFLGWGGGSNCGEGVNDSNTDPGVWLKPSSPGSGGPCGGGGGVTKEAGSPDTSGKVLPEALCALMVQDWYQVFFRCVLSDRSFLCFRLSLKIEPGDGSPRLASHKKELAGTQRRASVKVPQYLLEPLGVFWFML